MTQYRNHVASLLAIAFGMFASAPAIAASPKQVSNWTGGASFPSDVTMYSYVPSNVATNPLVLTLVHYCGGTASAVFGQASGLVTAADKYGFVIVVPSSGRCWDVVSTKTRTRDTNSDSGAIKQMVQYAITTYKANADRVYVTGDSSGGMMTELLLAVYPDIFKGGASFAGIPAGCGNSTSSPGGYDGTCAGSGNPKVSTVNQTAQQWGDTARAMDPGYSGHHPRVQLFHGDADDTIAFTNQREAIKEWTNVLGLSTNPTSTETGLTLGSHQATRQRWQNSCGYVVLEAIESINGDHGPSDALFNSSFVVPFLGLDNTDATDPEVAKCGTGGTGGGSGVGGSTSVGGAASTGGTQSIGGSTSAGGAASGGTKATTAGGAPGTGGVTSAIGGAATGGNASAGGSKASGGSSSTGGNKASGGMPNTGGSASMVAGSSATGGSPGTGGLNGNGGTGGTNPNVTSGNATGGSSIVAASSLATGQGGGVVTNSGSGSPSDSGSCGCRIAGADSGHRGGLGALFFAACATALRGRRKGRK
jgi:acetylxylan esterase